MPTKSAKATPDSRNDSLADMIAQSFGEPGQEEWYYRICRTHERHIVYRAYSEVMDVPSSQIRKSRRALFVYLIKKYESQT